MKQVTTYVGIDAHKKDLFVAMLVGAAPTPVTWQLANESGAVRRMVRKLERAKPARAGTRCSGRSRRTGLRAMSLRPR